jgi:hypothetical protein
MSELYAMSLTERKEYEAEYNEWLDSLPGDDRHPEEDLFEEEFEDRDLEEEYIDDVYVDEEVIGYEDLINGDYFAERELDFN